jgi:hypothetical protein
MGEHEGVVHQLCPRLPLPSDQNQERPMIRKTMFAFATVAAIAAAALIPRTA